MTSLIQRITTTESAPALEFGICFGDAHRYLIVLDNLIPSRSLDERAQLRAQFGTADAWLGASQYISLVSAFDWGSTQSAKYFETPHLNLNHDSMGGPINGSGLYGELSVYSPARASSICVTGTLYAPIGYRSAGCQTTVSGSYNAATAPKVERIRFFFNAPTTTENTVAAGSTVCIYSAD